MQSKQRFMSILDIEKKRKKNQNLYLLCDVEKVSFSFTKKDEKTLLLEVVEGFIKILELPQEVVKIALGTIHFYFF